MFEYYFIMLLQCHWDECGLDTINEWTMKVHERNNYTQWHCIVHNWFN